MGLLESTVRSSDPGFTSEGLNFVSAESLHLRGRADVCFFVPGGKHTAPLPLVILLHGAYGAFWHWSFRGGVHRIAAELMAAGDIVPMVLAMPTDGCTDASTGYFAHADADYESWIVEDVPRLARITTTTVTDESSLFLAGYSMGGFGALRLGARHADRVAGISAHSAVTDLQQLPAFLGVGSRTPVPRDPEDAAVIKAIRAAGKAMPPLQFDCGTDDRLLEPNRQLSHSLDDFQIAHTFTEHPGGHDWDYWRARFPATLSFFSNLSESDLIAQGRVAP